MSPLRLALLCSLLGTPALPLPAETALDPRAEIETAPITANQTISVDFDDYPIDEIVRNLALHFHLKVHPPPGGIHGNASLTLRDATWRQIFNVVLATAGYGFFELDGSVYILTEAEITALPATTRYVELYFQNPLITERHLNELFPAQASFSATSTGLNYTAKPPLISRIEAELARVDSPAVRLDAFARPVFFPEKLPQLTSAPAHPVRSPSTGDSLDDSISTNVFVLEKVPAAAVSRYLKDHILDYDGRVQTDLRTNSVIVTAPSSILSHITHVIAYLDHTRWYLPADTAKPDVPPAPAPIPGP
jgi:type II secretory pathway component GspD/PulD (secretin)